MPRPRFERLPAEKREWILLAAGREFAEHGYDGATMNLILTHAGISTGAAYYYFDNKADLFATVVRFHLERFLDTMPLDLDASDTDGFWASIRRAVDATLDRADDLHRVLGALKATWKASSEARAIPGLDELFARQEDLVRALIATGRRVGAVSTGIPEDLIALIVLAVDDAFDTWLQRQPALDGAALRALVGPILDAVRRLSTPSGDKT